MKSKRKLTDDQIKAMLLAHKAGIGARILMRKYKISDATFYTYKKKYNPLPKPPKPTEKYRYFVSSGSAIVGAPIADSKSELDKLQDAMSAYDNLSIKAKALFDKYYNALNAMD